MAHDQKTIGQALPLGHPEHPEAIFNWICIYTALPSQVIAKS